jgi:hypothetical protein
VTDWANVFLGMIALATLAMAIMQIAVLVGAARLARRIERFIDHAERELKPIMGHLNAIGRDASWAASLTAAHVDRVDRVITTQVELADRVLATRVERADRVFTALGDRLGQTFDTIQTAASWPVREGAALLVGFRAALDIIRARNTPRRAP